EGSFLQPLYEEVRRALLEKPLLPTHDDRHQPAVDVRLARGAGLRELVSPAQLGSILGLDREVAWLSAEISPDRTPDLHRYLAGYKPRAIYAGRETPALVQGMELDAEAVVNRLATDFLDQQSTEWMIRLYAWLSSQAALMRNLREREIIRRSDGHHVAAY